MATEADQDALNKLISLLVKLKKSCKKSLADDEAAEDSSKANYKSLTQKLNADIAALTTALKKQGDNLDSYRREVTQLTTEIKTLKILLSKNQKLLNDTIVIRDNELAKYNEDTKHRNREKSIINKLRKIVDEKLAKMKDFLKSRVN